MLHNTHENDCGFGTSLRPAGGVEERGRQDTFSAVIERLIPPKGTLGAALEAAQSLPDLPSKEFESLEKAVNATRRKLTAAWK